MLYGSLTRILTQKESQKAIHSCLYNKCHKTLSSFIFHSPNQNLDDFIGSIQVELNLYKDVFIRLQIEITEYAELNVFFISLLTLMSNFQIPIQARIISKFNLQGLNSQKNFTSWFQSWLSLLNFKNCSVFKGQLISKANCQAVNSSKKQTENFCPSS